MKLDATTAQALLHEGLVPLTDIPKLIPPAASGRPLHRAVGWRWARSGVLGRDGRRVCLEAVLVGKRWMTSRFALARFFDALSGAGGQRPGGLPTQPAVDATGGAS